MNVAGVQAVVTGIGVIALMCGAGEAELVDKMTIDILDEIVEEKLNNTEKSVMLRLANCAWGAGQSFRTDKGPLGCMTNMNIFDMLLPEEVAKDMNQIMAAAKFILKKLPNFLKKGNLAILSFLP